MKKLFGIIMMSCLMFGIAGCSGGEPGTPPEVVINGTKVVVGETKPKDLEEAGFSVNDLAKGTQSTLPEKSWAQGFFLEKDKVAYSNMVLVNSTKESLSASSCVIEELKFYDLEQEDKNIDFTINGVNPIRMSVEEIEAKFPGAEGDNDPEKSVRIFTLESGNDYRITFLFADGVVNDIEVKHSFEKSYTQKK